MIARGMRDDKWSSSIEDSWVDKMWMIGCILKETRRSSQMC